MARIRRLPLPVIGDTFLWRICKALDEPPRMLAHNIGVPYEELAPLLRPMRDVAGLNDDEIWWRISGYVAEKLGLLMAIQSEMQKQLDRERMQRVLRMSHQGRTIPKENPRGHRSTRHPFNPNL